MEDRTNESGIRSDEQNTVTTPSQLDVIGATDAHGITIDAVRGPAGTPLRASCLCGWRSPVVPSRPRAEAHGEAHLIRVAVQAAQALRESIQTTRTAAGTLRGEHCPWWCANTDPDHLTEYDLSENDDDQILYRIHARYFGDNDLAVTQDEKNDHGVTSMLPVTLHVYSEPETADEAKQHAGWLAEAAALLEQIGSEARPAEHAPWCTSLGALCGHGTDCYWSPDDGSESGVVLAEHQTAKNARYKRDGDPRAFVRVTMSRNYTDEFQRLSRGRDRYLATLILQFGRGQDDQEIDLTIGEAREVARRLTVACDLADEDVERVTR